ncbi:uncharacterized protein KLLA0_E24927g [Kluyveromyces lactis]|uniref:KLLA0E24927p n=1 Tax=Kluyveromyces lactis (strain ATCC 8585 / CBS 2359 / DSM 70799 / NBRC 1267 / NRRL Y-1140 / WM37) TaxID=284590 RepID=Q6CLW4_KLULA|nr:uncharacterized protein KLLA0_E24927g [Kluyveromyces lactis]CAH00162.1 KLLA0E24927p [Kluyveromyces lactis]|eukprot:XP_455075.1 uncharacterized protein KLLA0_E24927g [Kluyveromyces lactis]
MKIAITSSVFAVSFFARLITAASATFSLKVDAPDTKVDGFNVYLDSDYRVMLAKTDQSLSATIQDDGTLLLDDGKTMGIGRNYLSAKAISSAWIVAEPWAIEGGKLTLYGGNFHSVYSRSDDVYVLGSSNAAAGRPDMIEVNIIPLNSEGNVVADYSAGSVSSSLAASSATTVSSFLSSTTSVITSSESTSEQSSSEVVKSTFYSSSSSSSSSSFSPSSSSTYISSESHSEQNNSKVVKPTSNSPESYSQSATSDEAASSTEVTTTTGTFETRTEMNTAEKPSTISKSTATFNGTTSFEAIYSGAALRNGLDFSAVLLVAYALV